MTGARQPMVNSEKSTGRGSDSGSGDRSGLRALTSSPGIVSDARGRREERSELFALLPEAHQQRASSRCNGCGENRGVVWDCTGSVQKRAASFGRLRSMSFGSGGSGSWAPRVNSVGFEAPHKVFDFRPNLKLFCSQSFVL